MASVTVDNATKWHIMPINYCVISSSGGYDTYANLEEGSTFKLAALTRMTDRGGPRVVAYKAEITMIVLQNDYPNWLDGIKNLSNYDPTDFDLVMKPSTLIAQEQGKQLWFSMDTKQGQTAPLVKSWSSTFEIEDTKESPRMKITITGIFSTDILTKCDIFTLT